MKKEKQAIELLKLIAYQDTSGLVDVHDYLGIILANKNHAITILEANGIHRTEHIISDEEKLNEINEYRKKLYE